MSYLQLLFYKWLDKNGHQESLNFCLIWYMGWCLSWKCHLYSEISAKQTELNTDDSFWKTIYFLPLGPWKIQETFDIRFLKSMCVLHPHYS